MKNLDAHFDSMLSRHTDAQDRDDAAFEDAHAEVIMQMSELTPTTPYGYHGCDFVGDRLILDQEALLAALAKNDDAAALRILKDAFLDEVESIVNKIVYKTERLV